MKRVNGSGRMTANYRDEFKGTSQPQLIWLDPGITTGIFVCSIAPGWLTGNGPVTWEGLGAAMTLKWFAQVGRDARIWDGERAKAPAAGRVVDAELATAHPGLSAILDGQGRAGGGDITLGLADEIRQLLQCIAILDTWPDAAWGYESFQAHSAPGGATLSQETVSPIRINARLEAFEIVLGEKGRVPFSMTPSQGKVPADDERMKRAGLWRPGMGHAIDAARHACTFLRDCRAKPALRHQAWPKIYRAEIEETA